MGSCASCQDQETFFKKTIPWKVVKKVVTGASTPVTTFNNEIEWVFEDRDVGFYVPDKSALHFLKYFFDLEGCL